MKRAPAVYRNRSKFYRNSESRLKYCPTLTDRQTNTHLLDMKMVKFYMNKDLNVALKATQSQNKVGFDLQQLCRQNSTLTSALD